MTDAIGAAIKHYFVWLAGILSLLTGCETASIEAPPAYRLSPTQLVYHTPSGKPVVISREPRGVSFEIRDEMGNRFGFRIEPDGFVEWAETDGVLDRLTLESRSDLGVEVYRFNDQVVAVAREDIRLHGTFHAAFAAKARAERAIARSSLYHNPLGEEMVATFETTLTDIARQEKWVNDDGSCSRDMMITAGACAQWKCAAGGVANPLCHVCVGVTAACTFITVVSFLGGL